AVSYHCEVFFNGERLGEHEGAFLPFEFAVDAALLRPSNEIEVRVTVPSADQRAFPEFPFSEVPHGKISWYGRIGGLWQSVSLLARDARRLDRVTITAGMDGQVKADLAFTAAAAGLPARVEVRDGEGEVVARTEIAAAGAAAAELAVAGAERWDTLQPKLSTPSVTRGDGSDA